MGSGIFAVVLILVSLVLWGPRSFESHKAKSPEVQNTLKEAGAQEAIASFKIHPRSNDSAKLTILDERLKLSSTFLNKSITGLIYRKDGQLFLTIFADDAPRDKTVIPLQ